MEHIYVAVGLNGLLKVGRTANVKQRMRGLANEFKSKGDTLDRYHACDPLPDAYQAERRLIESVGSRMSIAYGREWFLNGSFDLAIRAAEELTEHFAQVLKDWKPYVIPEEAITWLRLREEQRAESRAYGEALRTKAEAAMKFRRRLRNAGLHAFNRLSHELHPEGRPCIDVAAPAAQHKEAA